MEITVPWEVTLFGLIIDTNISNKSTAPFFRAVGKLMER
jgi:hypothetical protein